MKIRSYYPLLPYPLTEGSFHVVYHQANALAAAGHEVHLIVWKDDAQEIKRKLSYALKDKESVVTEFHPQVRIATLQNPELGLKSAKEWLNVASVSSKNEKEGSLKRFTRTAFSLFSDFASPEVYYYPPKFNPIRMLSEAPFLKDYVDRAIYHYGFSYAWLKDLPRTALKEKSRVLYFHNLEHELFQERADFEPHWLKKQIHRFNSWKLKAHTLALANMVDEVWHVSPADVNHYLKLFETPPPIPVRMVPPVMGEDLRKKRLELWQKYRADNSDKMYLGFIGGLQHSPNKVSAMWIITKLAPLLKDAGFKGEILFAGRADEEEVRAAAKPYPFIKFLGFVENAEKDFWAKLSFSLNPHIGGSGVRTKILESLASGIPVLMNEEARDRLDPDVLKHKGLGISDSPQAWCKNIMQDSNFALREELSVQIMGETGSPTSFKQMNT